MLALLQFTIRELIGPWEICSQVNTTTPHWSLANIGPGNGLVPSGNKPSPEPMLTYTPVAIWRH